MRPLALGSPAHNVTYKKRTAFRCLIVNNGNYYKLRGGGVEPEDPNDEVACQREVVEETGCEVIIFRPEMIAQTTEYRSSLQQGGHTDICTILKDTGRVELTDLEASERLARFWCPVEEALLKMKAVEPTTELGEFIRKRDVSLLETFLDVET